MISSRAKKIGIKELEIFDNFQVDRNLPKYDNDKNNGKITYGDNNVEGGVWLSVPTSGDIIGDSDVNAKPSFMTRLISFFQKKLGKSNSTQVVEKRKLITILEFFTGLSKSYEELTPIANIAEHYQKALLQAKAMGQTALLQKLENLLNMIRGETHLIAMGLKKYVTEKQIIDFYEKVGEDNNLKLTWIKNFGRIIPEDVYEAKKNVDERKIFDNYVILHYDPENNGEKPTNEEIEKKKDPILFGVMKDSRKLYYVADWKDDYCDLTLEEMFKTLGAKTLQINNRTVKTFIDKMIV